MKKLSLSLLVLLSMAFTSCSYKVGTLSHPQIKTVAILPIQNTSSEPRAGFFMMQQLRERFMRDGSLKVTTADKADIIIRGDIKNYDLSVAGSVKQSETTNFDDRDEFFSASIYRAKIAFNYEIYTKDGWFVQAGNPESFADFTQLIDLEVEKRQAIKRASYEVAKKVVNNITEAW